VFENDEYDVAVGGEGEEWTFEWAGFDCNLRAPNAFSIGGEFYLWNLRSSSLW